MNCERIEYITKNITEGIMGTLSLRTDNDTTRYLCSVDKKCIRFYVVENLKMKST